MRLSAINEDHQVGIDLEDLTEEDYIVALIAVIHAERLLVRELKSTFDGHIKINSNKGKHND